MDPSRDAIEESEERYRLACEAADLGTWRRGGSSALLTLDARAQRHFGCDQPQVSVEELYERIHPGDREEAIRAGAAARQPGNGSGRFDMQYRVIHADGSIHWLAVSARLLFAGTGPERQLRLVIGTTRDISAGKADERERRQWADAFQNCGHGVALGDPATDRILACNPSFARLLGRDPATIVGLPIAEVYAPGVRERVAGRIGALEPGAHLRVETEFRRADDSTFPVELDVVMVNDDQGRPPYRVASAKDISVRRRAEDEVRRLNADLERRVAERTAELEGANAELESFAYAVSHDLRAPLRAMSGFSRALMEDFAADLPAGAREYLEHIAEGSRRMGELIDGLLVLARVTRGELRREPVDLSALAERLLREFESTEPGRRVSWDVARGLSARGDPRMIEIALRNLLGNAWKYSARAPAPRIVVRATQVAGRPGFLVEDNGAGFDMAHSDRLFLPFQRLHRQDEFPGLGIGLATVQRIVSRHGGAIDASAAPGQGARFSCTFAGRD